MDGWVVGDETMKKLVELNHPGRTISKPFLRYHDRLFALVVLLSIRHGSNALTMLKI